MGDEPPFFNREAWRGNMRGGAVYPRGGRNGMDDADWGQQRWLGGYSGSVSWTLSGGWHALTNRQALEAGINYNNNFNSWGHTAFGSSVYSSTEFGGGTFMFDYNGGNYGGTYHTENGQVMSVALSRLVLGANGGWKPTSASDEVTVFAESENSIVRKMASGLSEFWSGFTSSSNTTYYGSRTAVTSTALFWIDGVANSVKYSARTFGELRNVVKAEKIFKPLGVVGGIVTTSMTVYDARTDGNISNGDWFKIGMGALQVGLAFTPVGWGVLAYNGVDFLVGMTTRTSITDRIANGIDNIGK
jgi:hypothetical protein